MKWFLRTIAFLAVALGAAFLIFRTPDTDPAEMRAKYGGEPSQFVLLESGQKVHLRDEGPKGGLPIILLHGSNADLHTWQPWTEALSETHRVIRFDQIGHGLTGPSVSGTYALEDFTDVVDAVANQLGLDRFILAGNSMGGSIAAGYAIQNPDRVAGLVLVDASGSPERKPAGDGGNTGFSIATTPVLNQIVRFVTPRSIIEQSLRQSVSNKEIVTDAAVDRYWELLRYPGNRSATIERFATKRVSHSKDQVTGLAVPTLILWGEEDALIPVSAGKWYDEHLPNSQMVILPGIGHLPHEEAPEATLNVFKGWLKNINEPSIVLQ